MPRISKSAAESGKAYRHSVTQAMSSESTLHAGWLIVWLGQPKIGPWVKFASASTPGQAKSRSARQPCGTAGCARGGGGCRFGWAWLVAAHADAHTGVGEKSAVIAAVIGWAGLAWGSASLQGTGAATIAAVLCSNSLQAPVYRALSGSGQPLPQCTLANNAAFPPAAVVFTVTVCSAQKRYK